MDKMLRLFILTFVLFIFASCNKTDNITRQNDFIKLDSIQGVYLFTNEEPLRRYEASGTAYLTYDSKGRIIKREGGPISVPITTGYAYIIVKEVYDTISYVTNDVIVIDLKTSLTGIIFNGGKKELTLNNNLLSKKIAYNEWTNLSDNDTTYYYYDALKRMQKIEKYSSASYMVQNFVFDVNGNLTSINTTTRNRVTNDIFYTLEENFSNYDNTANLLKPFSAWSDMFLRSLSTNNFRKYTYKRRNSLNEITATQERNWTLVYDGSGNVDFSK